MKSLLRDRIALMGNRCELTVATGAQMAVKRVGVQGKDEEARVLLGRGMRNEGNKAVRSGHGATMAVRPSNMPSMAGDGLIHDIIYIINTPETTVYMKKELRFDVHRGNSFLVVRKGL